MAWALIASSAAQSSNGSVASFNLALGASTSVGQRIFCVTSTWKGSATPTTPTVSDNLNAGNYVEDVAMTGNDGGFQFRVSLWSKVVATGGTPTITVAPTTNNGGTGCVIWAISGLSTATDATAIDQSQSAAGTGGTASSGASAATTGANEYAAGVYGDDGWGAVSASSGNVGSGWTYVLGTGHSAPSGDVFVEHKDSGTSGSTVTANLNTGVPGGGTTWTMAAVIYKLAGAAAQDTPELYGRSGLKADRQMRQLLAQ